MCDSFLQQHYIKTSNCEATVLLPSHMNMRRPLYHVWDNQTPFALQYQTLFISFCNSRTAQYTTSADCSTFILPLPCCEEGARPVVTLLEGYDVMIGCRARRYRNRPLSRTVAQRYYYCTSSVGILIPLNTVT